MDAFASQGDLLQRNGIDVQLVDYLGNAPKIVLSIATDAKVDVVGSEANFRDPVWERQDETPSSAYGSARTRPNNSGLATGLWRHE